MSTLVVDDEELARNLVSSLVRRDPELLLSGECADGGSALDTIRSARPDLVFLDIQMPVMNGLAVAAEIARLPHVPYVIFVTAFDDYAIRAFDLQALDYLVKPIAKERFRLAVARAKAAIRNAEMLSLTERLLELSQSVPQASGVSAAEELTVRCGDRLVQLATRDIDWLEAANQYVTIHAGNRSYTVSESLGQYAKRISDPQFFRIHRSALVNGRAVAAVARRRNGTHALTLKSGATLVVARSRSAMVPGLLRAVREAAEHG